MKQRGLLITHRRRAVGDLVNLPDDANGVSHPGHGFVWQVAAATDDELQLTFVRPSE